MKAPNWWKITKLELMLTARDKEAVIWSLIAPIAFAYVFGFMVRDAPERPPTASIDRGDNPAYVETIFSGLLEKKGIVVSRGENYARVVLPDSLISKIVGGRAVGIKILKREANEYRVRAVSVKAREILYTLVFRARKEWLTTPPGEGEIAALVESEGPILIETSVLGKKPKVAVGAEHTLPAMLVMFLLFQLTTFFMVLWVEDVRTGKIKRILLSPTSVTELFTAQIAFRIMWAVLQVVVICGVGALVMGVRLEIPYVYAAVLLLAYMLAATSLGILLASFFTTVEKANAIGVMIALVFAALGGCWWPLEVVQNDTMRTVAKILPTGLMMDALADFIALGKSAPFPTANFAGLALMGAVLLPIGVRRLRKQIIR